MRAETELVGGATAEGRSAATNVTSALAVHARQRPDRLALIVDDQTLTFSHLENVVGRLATYLAEQQPGGIALHLPNGLALALLVLAAARAGREAQVLDPGLPLDTTRAVLAAVRPALVVSADAAIAAGTLTVRSDATADELLEVCGAPAQPRTMPACDPEAPFYVGFTSGSTGEPKGFRRSHRSWLESFRGDGIEFGLGNEDVVLAPGNLTHSLFLYALVNGLHAGASVVLCRRFRPNVVPRLIREHRATVLYGVPTQIALIIDAVEERGEGPFPELRWVLSSGAKWFSGFTPRLRRIAPRARFAEFYGASELSFVTVAKDGEQIPEGSVGRAFAGVTITIRDRKGRRLPTGRTGRVFVESPLVFSGYAYGGDGGCLHAGNAVSVGDMGYLDEHGFLHLVGRANRMIVTSGKNLYPEEVERVLERHPDVAAAAVLAFPDRRRGERIVAIIAAGGDMPRQKDLIAYARGALPLFKVPRTYGFVREWPLTRSGKTDLAALRRLWERGAVTKLP